ncbi:MAG: oxidoreductase [Chloroflexi bacterium]|nr:MAG: oxidoreductase [Chloroflexota bacterium]TMG30503.1 MAG: oxidoreductase [Chloroflexota bacterium]
MARAALLGRLSWQFGELVELVHETPRVSSLYFNIPMWPGHLAGQHVDVRLTAEDGYQAERSYSIASPPEARWVALTVERLDDGEVSPYLVGELKVGDKVELRGPIGGHFVWRAGDDRPLLLVAGGSGVVPLMAMLRHRATAPHKAPARLLYSSRALADIIYREEIDRLVAANDGLLVSHTLTREKPAGWSGYTRRIDAAMVKEVAWPKAQTPAVFVCGPTPFVETAADLLVGLEYDPLWIKTERFGATGGAGGG